MQTFVIWLDGYLEAVGDNMNISKTNVIKNKLDRLFEHVAEPVEIKPTLASLGEQHGFPVYVGFPNNERLGEDENGVTYRC